MKKGWLCLIMMALLPICLFAQNTPNRQNNNIRLSREEFQKRHEAYITKYAGLTPEEAAKFFPLYNELQNRKNELNDQTGKYMRETWGKELDENKYKEILEGMSANAIASENLERTYLDKFREVISYKKIFKIREAESRFRQELVRGMRRPGGNQGRGGAPEVPDSPSNDRRR